MKKFLAVAAFLTVAAMFSGPPASAQQAAFQQTGNQLYFFGNVCANLQCLNDVLGGTANHNPIQWWHWGGSGEPNNDWNVWKEGNVQCDPNTFPFYSLNNELLTDCKVYWKGDNVFKFAFAPNGNGSGKCIDGGAANPSVARQARIWLATVAPQASPRWTDRPGSAGSSESWASVAASWASNIGLCAGIRATRAV